MECVHQDFGDGDPVVRRYGIGAAALRYQGHGYAVLALARGRKKPHRMLGDSGGVHWASTDNHAVKWSWKQDRAANVGVACGSPSRLVVVDLDVKNGDDGPGELTKFMSEYGLGFRGASIVSTPSGGTHLWMRVPAGYRVAGHPRILPGVDILGDGNLVVAPPSMTFITGRDGEQVPVPYMWTRGCFCTAPDAPPWLLQWVASAGPSSSGGAYSGEEVDLDELKAKGAPVGTRNRELYRAACSLHRRYEAEQVLTELYAIWQAGDTSGMPWREVLTLAESARKFIDDQKQRERRLRESWLRGHGR